MKKIHRVVSWLLIMILVFNLNLPVLAYERNQVLQVQQSVQGESFPSTEETLETEQQPEDNTLPSTDELPSEAPVPNTGVSLFEGGLIKIYTLEQLMEIGKGTVVKSGDGQTLGSGDPVLDEQGEPLSYSLDGQYQIVQDIELPRGRLWNLPEGFTGRIVPGHTVPNTPLYDHSSQRILIYHPYQLQTMALPNAAEQPVLDQDWNPETFGIGNLIYPDPSSDQFLTYDPNASYTISATFCSDQPPRKASAVQTTPAKDSWGRDFPGQVIKTINQETYILIGNVHQLKAIGSDEVVHTAVYQTKFSGLSGHEVDTDQNGNPIMLYGGDADLLQEQNGKKEYEFGKIEHEALLKNKCGVNQITGEIDVHLDVKDSGQKYTNDANYIIFRDLDLNTINDNPAASNWTPLPFSGKMIGAKTVQGESLWDDTAVLKTGKPVIKNVRIRQDQKLEVNKYIGIGFFSTLSNEVNIDNIGVSKGTVQVSNLAFQNISVHTTTDQTKSAQTILGALTSGLGWLVGGLLDILTGALSFGNIHLNLRDTLSHLLNARAEDPTRFATGAFAGRIEGDVRVDNCTLEQVQVGNINDYTGGFVGYATGLTKYDGLSQTLGVTVNALASLLNAIPGLGLGDLITILLKNGLDVGSLIPTGYYNPVIENCSVSYDLENKQVVGSESTSFNGGFVGNQIGTRILGCCVSGDTLTVQAKQYGGGFSGLSRDAEIKGLLTDVGLELIRVAQPQSTLINCHLQVSSNLEVSGESYLGGFTGAYANSYAIDNTMITPNLQVRGSEDHVGGYAGVATVGWVTNLGSTEKTDNSLLSTVKDLLTGLLSSNPDKAQMLLTLVGIQPSAIMGCQVNPNSADGQIEISGKNYVGGMVGGGDGLLFAASSPENLGTLPLWKWQPDQGHAGIPAIETRGNGISGLKSVLASQDYAGGIIGFCGTASVAGLLNGTLGIGNFLGFTVSDTVLKGSSQGCQIQAGGNYAGGAVGLALGGKMAQVNLKEIGRIQAGNDAGGFAGGAGTGSLIGNSGLTLGILGLNHVLEIKNLLSVGQGIQVQINDVSVKGRSEGMTVEATGQNTSGEKRKFSAGGFIGHSNSVAIGSAQVQNLKWVKASDHDGSAGGFVGISETGGLAEVADETSIKELVHVNGLLGAITYLVPSYTSCTVSYVDQGFVQADVAGGFAGQLLSGKVDNSQKPGGDGYAVYNLDHVQGRCYAGGFGGMIQSGALADGGGGISILGGIPGLNIDLNSLLSVVNAYMPVINQAGVQSKGLMVSVTGKDDKDLNSGSAGGYVGFASGAQISGSHVNQLRHTVVKTPKVLNAEDGSIYYGQESSYAVRGIRNAGGYAGRIDIGSSASVGGGLGVLGDTLLLNDILSVLDVVASKIEHSNVYGAPGGFSVLADGKEGTQDPIGNAGGYAASVYGSQLQDCNVYNFAHIVGRETAGGYAGTLQPGNVTSLIGKTEVLGGLLTSDTNLASVLQTFIPMVYNSETTCVPCGGSVRADAPADATRARGLAGGYVGYNLGGRIEGQSTRSWKGAQPNVLRENAVYRLRNVYGYEFAGGYSGRTECANVADTGNLKVLFGLIKISNPLQALSAVYPTETHTAIYGPLRGLTLEVWNAWVEAVGKEGSYGQQLQGAGHLSTQEELDRWIAEYAYGYDIFAGRKTAGSLSTQGGAAGGYAGRMDGGVVTYANAVDLKSVQAHRSSGGFVGEMMTGGVAELGGIELVGIDVTGSLPVLQTFVPVIKTSTVTGYQSGATVSASGTDHLNQQGHAGGFAGMITGGQIWGEASKPCLIKGLRQVKGTQTVGGFAGSILPGSAVTADIGSKSGLLSGILGNLLTKSSELATVLNATLSTVNYAGVEAWNGWGIVIDGAYQMEHQATTQYAYAAGGFAGNISGAVLGDRKASGDALTVTNLKKVTGGEHVGGFFGLADVSALAQVGDNASKPILNLIQLGELDVLDTFRTYIYHGKVTGAEDGGLTITANTETEAGTLTSKVYTGNAGGFGGSLLDGSVKDSSVEGLTRVEGLNYCGGFIGHSGRSGGVDLDAVETSGILPGLLNATAGVMDNFGSHIERCEVSGISEGFVIKSKTGKNPIAGGFAGYTDLAKISDSQVQQLNKVESDQIAGGFAGKTSFSYLAQIDAGSASLLDPVFSVVNTLLDFLYIDNLEQLNAIEIDLGLGKLLRLEVLNEGNLLSVTLLGLKISVALVKSTTPGQSDLAQIHIGDSYIELPCTNLNGKQHISEEDKENLKIGLIKSNRTTISQSSVTGIASGYDIYGGGASVSAEGQNPNGYAGGFIGYNVEGLLKDNDMYYADAICGTADKTGPFTGVTSLDSNYHFNTVKNIEGVNNNYRVYRDVHTPETLVDQNGQVISQAEVNTDPAWHIFPIQHILKVPKFETFNGAMLTGSQTAKEGQTPQKEVAEDAEIYRSPAKAVLMADVQGTEPGNTETPLPPEMQDPCSETIHLTINKVWRDFNNIDGLRPEQITVHLTRFYMNQGQKIEDTEFIKEVIIQGDLKDNTWQLILEDLPAYCVLEDGETKAYYTYTISETPVSGYTEKLETSADGFTATITNTHFPLLPDTGGSGVLWIALCGILGISVTLLLSQPGKKRQG